MHTVHKLGPLAKRNIVNKKLLIISVLLFQVKGVGKCGYYRLWKEGMEDEDEEEEKAKKEVRCVRMKYGTTCS